MKYVIGILCLLFAWPYLHGQGSQGIALYTDEDLRQLGTLGPMSAGARTIDLRYEGVIGTPLLFDEWKKAALKLKGKEGFGNEVSINIDGENNNLYFQLPGGYTSSIPAEKLQAVKVQTAPDEYRLFEVLPANEVEGGRDTILKYYETLYDGQFRLLKQDRRFLLKADYKGPYSPDRRHDEYTSNVSYWLKEDGDGYEKVKFRRKSIQQALPKQEGRVKKLIKENDLNLDTEADMVDFLKLLESENG